MNIVSELLFFYDRKIRTGFRVGKNALVVDIGSGEKPFWRGDVFVDKLSLGNIQRASKFDTIHDFGTFVDSDVADMPFKTGAFDFSFASHLLEHVEDPGRVISEITRISKAGYIEVPNGIIETIKPFDSHLWMVFWDKKKLTFVRKSKLIHNTLTKNGKGYEYLLGKAQEPFIRLSWKKKIDYEIIDNLKVVDKFRSGVGDVKSEPSSFNYYYLLVKIIRLLFYKDKKQEKINKVFKSQKYYVKKK